MIDFLEEMSLQRSIYHFYLWKEAQLLKYEQCLQSGRSKSNAMSHFDTETDEMKSRGGKRRSTPESDNENENLESKDSATSKNNSITPQRSKTSVVDEPTIGGIVNKEDDRYSVSAKYRRVLNILKEEFPTIDSGCPPVTLIPDVYTRYSMYPKLCRDYTFLREQHGTEIARTKPKERNENNFNDSHAAATTAPTTDNTAAIHTNSRKRKHQESTTVAPTAATEEEAPSPTNMSECITKRDDVPVDVKEQFLAIQNEAQEQKKMVSVLSRKIEEQTKRYLEQERQRALRLERQKSLLEKRKRARLGVSNLHAKSSDVKISDKKGSNAKRNKAKRGSATSSSAKRSKGTDSDNSDNDNVEDDFPVSFDKRFELLKHFQEGHGHCRVTSRQNKRMNTWVTHLRAVYRKMQEEPTKKMTGPDGEEYEHSNTQMGLTPERIRQLEEIGFEWVIKKKPPLTWDERYEQLKEFKEKHGHCVVMRTYKENPSLGEWVHYQRYSHAKKLKVLTPERIAKLDALGFVWRVTVPKNEYSWDIRLEHCVEFRRKHGHLKVPAVNARNENGDKPDEEDKRFRRWAQQQRMEYRKYNQGLRSLLDGKRIKQLKALEFSFDLLPRGKKKKSDQSNKKPSAAANTLPDHKYQTSPPQPIPLTNVSGIYGSKPQDATMNEAMRNVQAFDGGDEEDESSSVDVTDNDGDMP